MTFTRPATLAAAFLILPLAAQADCSDYTTQNQAQAAFLAGAHELDRDNDGLACEHLPTIETLQAADTVDDLGTPSFLWQYNGTGVQPRSRTSYAK